MGMTLTTLHFYKLDRSEVEPNIDSTDLIRDLNAPWLSVLPTNDSPIDDMHRLVKLAKLLTKNNDAAALLFYYFDDFFFPAVFSGVGRKRQNARVLNLPGHDLGRRISEVDRRKGRRGQKSII